MRKLLLAIALLATACATTVSLPTKPNDKEWNLLSADQQWLDTLRKAQPVPSPSSSRKQQIEIVLDNIRKITEPYNTFITKVMEYYERTGDPRAAHALASEKIVLGDQYMNVLSRYDRALDYYRQALEVEPSNAEARSRIATAEKRRYVAMSSFANVKSGMKEDEVRKLVGLPREDWIKQVVQNTRVYSVWIYPKSDGGASAVYFDNGVVYHTNWNAAAPPAAQTK